MSDLNFQLPESLLLTTGQSREEFIKDAKFLLALKMFELGRLSSGRASEACDMSRVDFILAAGRMGVAVADVDDDEVDTEFSK
jgi:predicted HTH domain antitoxin